MIRRLSFGLLLLVLLGGLSPAVQAQTFLPDDPVQVDPDTLDIDPPTEFGVSDYYNALRNVLGHPGEVDAPAVNVNTLGEVPRSTWYAPRHYFDRMTLEELVRGPNMVSGPDTTAPWSVVSMKVQGVTPGMTIEDERGDRYLIKFDAPAFVEMSTGAEVIATKLFYALGYHVPQNFVVRFHPDRLRVEADATFETKAGVEKPITMARVQSLLQQAYRYPDGTHRALASKFLEGAPIGAFRYFDTRPDDPNDIFPHEARRELRGLRLAAAWLEHFDARAQNSLDVLIDRGDRQYIKHYLIDFGSTLGGGPLGPKRRWYGHEYVLETLPILIRAATLGFGASGWVDHDFPEVPAVGRFDVQHFDPESWRPGLPNPAFQRAQPQDLFWMARQIMHFTDDELRAIAETGQYSDPASTNYVAKMLAARRDKIGAAFLDLGGGLDRFRVEDGRLVFADLLATHGLATVGRERQAVWRTYDNATGDAGAVLTETTVTDTTVALPETEARFLQLTLTTPGDGATRVVLRRSDAGYAVVGLQRRGAEARFPDGWG